MGCSAYNKRRNGAAPREILLMLNENVKKLLKAGMWDLATCAGEMIERMKERYKDYLYIEGMPEDKANVPFYVKHGFRVMENGAAIQICSYSDKR